MKKMEKLTIRITETLKRDLENLAEADERPTANYIRQVLSMHVEKMKRSRKNKNSES